LAADAFESDVVGRLAGDLTDVGLFIILAEEGERGCADLSGDAVAGLDVDIWTLGAGRFALPVEPEPSFRPDEVTLLSRCLTGVFCGVFGFGCSFSVGG